MNRLFLHTPTEEDYIWEGGELKDDFSEVLLMMGEDDGL